MTSLKVDLLRTTQRLCTHILKGIFQLRQAPAAEAGWLPLYVAYISQLIPSHSPLASLLVLPTAALHGDDRGRAVKQQPQPRQPRRADAW
jgi:hypothetical protein